MLVLVLVEGVTRWMNTCLIVGLLVVPQPYAAVQGYRRKDKERWEASISCKACNNQRLR